MKTRILYILLIVMGICKASEGERRPLLRSLITRSITIEDVVEERAQEEMRKKREEQLLDPNSPPIPAAPVVVPRRISPVPLRRLHIIPGQNPVNPFSPDSSPLSADLSPQPMPRPVTPEDPHARAVMQSMFLHIMAERIESDEGTENEEEAPL